MFVVDNRIHPTAVLEGDIDLGSGNVIGPFTISGHAVGRSIRFSLSTDRGDFDLAMERPTSTANAP